MPKLYVFAVFVICLFFSVFICQPSQAISPNVMISQVQLGVADLPAFEFVEIYNNSSTDVEITNWCLRYASAASTTNGNKLVCFETDNTAVHLYLPSFASAFAISDKTEEYRPNLGYDVKFLSPLSATAGYLRLINNIGTEVDKLGWGDAALLAEGGKPAPSPLDGQILERKAISLGVLKDTDINSDDFEIVAPRTTYSYGQLYEINDLCLNIEGVQESVPNGYVVNTVGACVVPVIDVCPNIEGLQPVIIIGYLLDGSGNCQPDVCLNIDGLQMTLPSGKDLEVVGKCVDHDECPNLDEIQAILPTGYTKETDGTCKLNILPLKITELLPNPIGTDNNSEFIEIYNPNAEVVDLANYILCVSSSGDIRSYYFSEDLQIQPNEYLALRDSVINFTLVNTASIVQLLIIDGTLIDETVAYEAADEGMAWAIINDAWQYSNQPTPGASNLASIAAVTDNIAPIEEASTILKPCPAGQYRNTETNRCRLLVSSEPVLTPCKEGQYRSQDTNRCRNIVSEPDVGSPVVLGASDLKPCAEGKERNPETNRCRNIISSTIPTAGYAPQQTNQPQNDYVLWWSLAGVGAIAVGYGIWEWRQEILRLVKKIISFVRRRK